MRRLIVFHCNASCSLLSARYVRTISSPLSVRSFVGSLVLSLARWRVLKQCLLSAPLLLLAASDCAAEAANSSRPARTRECELCVYLALLPQIGAYPLAPAKCELGGGGGGVFAGPRRLRFVRLSNARLTCAPLSPAESRARRAGAAFPLALCTISILNWLRRQLSWRARSCAHALCSLSPPPTTTTTTMQPVRVSGQLGVELNGSARCRSNLPGQLGGDSDAQLRAQPPANPSRLAHRARLG